MRTKLIALLISLSIIGGIVVPEVLAQSGTQQLARAIIRTLIVRNTATFQDAVTIDSGGLTVTAGGLTITAGGATVTDGGLTLSDDNLTVADFINAQAQSALAPSDGGVITPTGSYQPLTPTANVTVTMSSGCTAGNLVNFTNTTTWTLVVSETAAVAALSGNASLGQYDTLSVLCDGTRWIETAQVDN